MNGYKKCDGRMQAPAPRSASFSVQCSTFGVRRSPRGFTLVEVLVATTLTLIMMFAVVQIFGMISGSVSDSRAILEMNDRLRAAKTLLQKDLEGLTIVPLPPGGDSGDGYLEIIEGPVGAAVPTTAVARNTTDGATATLDTTVADFDDILMFTTRNVAADGNHPIAEVAWFVYGNRLIRRTRPVPHSGSLARLARRENRVQLLRSPPGRQSSFPFRVVPPYRDPDEGIERDFWTSDVNEHQNPGSFFVEVEDVVLNNVIGFDVKVFDPMAAVRNPDGSFMTDAGGNLVRFPDYVDLGYANDVAWEGDVPISPFSHAGILNSGLAACVDATGNGTCDTCDELGRSSCIERPHRVYDTWTASNVVPPPTNSSDPDYEPAFWGPTRYPPPYPSALRGIQVKIRVFEPDSRMIREVTIIQDFLPR